MGKIFKTILGAVVALSAMGLSSCNDDEKKQFDITITQSSEVRDDNNEMDGGNLSMVKYIVNHAETVTVKTETQSQKAADTYKSDMYTRMRQAKIQFPELDESKIYVVYKLVMTFMDNPSTVTQNVAFSEIDAVDEPSDEEGNVK